MSAEVAMARAARFMALLMEVMLMVDMTTVTVLCHQAGCKLHLDREQTMQMLGAQHMLR